MSSVTCPKCLVRSIFELNLQMSVDHNYCCCGTDILETIWQDGVMKLLATCPKCQVSQQYRLDLDHALQRYSGGIPCAAGPAMVN
jgi:predicted nucleic-acid-binding Zn-ribbon protein